MRRNEGQERVIGTLLGANNDGVLEITNCFPVPHTEKESVGIDMDFHKTMYQLFRQSNPTEIILGWYTTSEVINDHSILIHDFYGREIQRPPVHVCVGVDLSQGRGVTLSAFMGTSVALKDRVFGSHFSQIPLTLAVEGSDRAVLQAAVAGAPAAPQGQVAATLAQLSAMLVQLLAHVRDAGNRDPAVGRALLGALQQQQHARELSDAACDAALQDVLSVVTLGKLTRAQIEVCASLNSLFAPAPQ
jgi:translation initiation factor 3 subunit F